MSELASAPVRPIRRNFARKLMIDLSIMTVIGAVLAWIGPFGSANAPFALRLISWVGLCYVGYAIYNPVGWFVEYFHRTLHLPKASLWIGLVLLATIPASVAIWIANFLPNGPVMPSADEALSAYLNVLVIGASITVLFVLIERANGNDAAPPPMPLSQQDDPADTSAATPRPSFLDRLPAELGSDLIAPEMEDHYVRAHPALGSDLVLMRMRDAVGELDGLGGIDGAQVHRSWWVARRAVEDVRREGRNIRLILPSGLEAPVSRSMASRLKSDGWW